MLRMPAARAAACLAFTTLAACATLDKTPPAPDLAPWPEIRPDFRVEALRSRLTEYAVTFAAAVESAAASIERQAADAGVRRNAILWRTRGIPEMRKACFRPEPAAGLVDAWTLARQMDHFFSRAGADDFGALQPVAVAASRRMLDEIRAIGASIAVSPESVAAFERRVIEPWVADHPLGDLGFVRESSVARFAQQGRASGDLLDSFGTLEELAVGLSQQTRMYLADLPRQVRGEVDLLRLDVMTDLAPLVADAHLGAAAADRLAAVAEGLPSLVETERRAVLTEVSRERALALAALSDERERAVGAIVSAFADERGELLRGIDEQRLATLTWATAERREVLTEVRRELAGSLAAVRAERTLVTDDLRRLVDLVMLRAVLLLVAAVVLAPFVAHVYARVWPRRRADPAAR
jgi:hypothetical protein